MASILTAVRRSERFRRGGEGVWLGGKKRLFWLWGRVLGDWRGQDRGWRASGSVESFLSRLAVCTRRAGVGCSAPEHRNAAPPERLTVFG